MLNLIIYTTVKGYRIAICGMTIAADCQHRKQITRLVYKRLDAHLGEYYDFGDHMYHYRNGNVADIIPLEYTFYPSKYYISRKYPNPHLQFTHQLEYVTVSYNSIRTNSY